MCLNPTEVKGISTYLKKNTCLNTFLKQVLKLELILFSCMLAAPYTAFVKTYGYQQTLNQCHKVGGCRCSTVQGLLKDLLSWLNEGNKANKPAQSENRVCSSLGQG